MAGKSTDEFTFRKANQAVTLGSRSTVKIKGEHVNIDPQLLFQRLLTVRECCDDVTSLFQYELCTYPAALFESSSLPLQQTMRYRYLQITSGNQWKKSNGTLAEMSSMSLMVVLYYIEYHGHEAPPMRVWATCMLCMWLRNTVLLPLS